MSFNEYCKKVPLLSYPSNDTYRVMCEQVWDHQQTKIDNLQTKLDEMISYIPKLDKDSYMDMPKKISIQQTKIDKLTKCVEFYAEEQNWDHSTHEDCPMWENDAESHQGIPGKRARQCLIEIN